MAARKKKSLQCCENTTKTRKKIYPQKLISQIRLLHPIKKRPVNFQKIQVAFSSSKTQKSKKLSILKASKDEIAVWLKEINLKFSKNEDIYIVNGQKLSFKQFLIFINKLRFERKLPLFKVF